MAATENIPEFIASTGVEKVHALLRGDWTIGRMIFQKPGVYMGGEKSNNGPHVEYAKEVERLIRTVTSRPLSHDYRSEHDHAIPLRAPFARRHRARRQWLAREAAASAR